jgi:hypothetical protein
MTEITTITLVYLARIIILFCAIMYTFVFIRNVGQLAGVLARGEGISFGPKIIIIPALLWTVFYILVQAPTFPMG